MAKPSKKTTDQKLRVVLSVLRGEHSVAEAARRNGVSEQSVHNWKKQFLDSGREGLEKGARRRSSRELELEVENEELKAALGEALWWPASPRLAPVSISLVRRRVNRGSASVTGSAWPAAWSNGLVDAIGWNNS